MAASTARDAASAMGVPIPLTRGMIGLVSAERAEERAVADAARGCCPALAGAGAGTCRKAAAPGGAARTGCVTTVG
jgi:hypothetical protein